MIAVCSEQLQTACIPAITIRDVPEETRNELAARAARSGRSLQEYLRRELIALAERPDREELWARIQEHRRTHGLEWRPGEIAELIRADRDGR